MNGNMTTGERIMKIETKLDDHIENESRIHTRMLSDLESINNKIDNLGNRFAGKWTEKLTLASVTGTLIAIITFILGKL